MAKAKKLKSGNWRVLVYSHTDIVNGKPVRRYKSFTHSDRRQAEYLAAEYATRRENTKNTPAFTLGEAMDKYIDSKDTVLSPSTVREYKGIRRCNLQGLMEIKLGELTQQMIQAEINQEAKTHAPKTVKNMHGLLSATLTMFRPDMHLTTTLPARKKTELYIPSDEDIVKVLHAIAGTELEKAVLLSAFGSLRRSEIAPLTDEDVNGTSITIEKAMVLNERNEWVIKPPKTFSSYRIIEYPQFVIDRFQGIHGRLVSLTPYQITEQFLRELKKIDVPKFRFHDLRHYQASILHALGVPDLYIMQRGGWKSVNTLNKVYKHGMDAKKEEVTTLANDHFTAIMQHEMQHEK